jgi:selT/selW/selH-like putative selenoprotein
MQYEIEFCVACYLPNALEVIRGLLESHAHDDEFSLKLMPGVAGSFEVRRDNSVVYSEKATGRLPQLQEIEENLHQIPNPLPIATQGSKNCC